MSYAGNPSLSSDIQKRVLGTFEQTLGLAAEGNRQEALLGCDFVLRMDSQFEPARRLQERLRDSAGPVRVDDLLAPAADDPFAGAINLDLPDVPGFGAPAVSAAAGPGDLRDRFHSFLEARRFQELLTLAHQEQEAVGRDPELMRMATAAQERMEAEPYVNKFLNAAQEAARQGQRDEVARLSEKIRALDPSHPGLAALSGAAPAAAPMATQAFAAPATDAADMGFEMSFDEPAGSLDLGTSLPDLSFDSPSLDLALDEPAGAPGMDPELVSAADFPSSLGSGGFGGGPESETDRRIRELLDEGQRAHDNGDLQGAIDAWSRIFLIDIDHQEAARRIEQARKLKAEHERQAEEIFHEGVAKIEAGDLQAARQSFQRVLEIQPGYFAAREYLQQIEAGKVPVIKPKPKETPSSSALPTPSDLDLDTGELKEEILIPPDPSEVAAAERQRSKQKQKPIGAAPAREGKARKMFILVGSVVLVLALAGGAFVYFKKDQLFPNSQTDEASIAGPAITDPIGRATELQKSGKTQSALSQLKRIPPSDPSYAQAQELIKQWSAQTAATAPTPGPAATPTAAVAPPPISPERLAILNAARDAYQSGSYLESIRRLEQASAQGQLEPADAEMLANAKRQIEPLAAQIDLFRQHEWEHALRDLWRMHESDPGNRDVTKLMVDSYYNLGLRDLQRMDSAKAIENFHEALGLDPNDRGLQRQLAFAQTYQERPKDLLYRIYVKHLPIR